MELVTERLGVDDNTADVTNILPKYIGKKGKKTGKGHKTEDASPSQEGTTSGAAGDIVDKKVGGNEKVAK